MLRSTNNGFDLSVGLLACYSAARDNGIKMENSMIKKIMISASAAAVALAPVAATAADVSPISVERQSEEAAESSELGGSSMILAILAAAAVIVGIIIAVDGDDEDVAVSP